MTSKVLWEGRKYPEFCLDWVAQLGKTFQRQCHLSQASEEELERAVLFHRGKCN